jgi:hypothetical protein
LLLFDKLIPSNEEFAFLLSFDSFLFESFIKECLFEVIEDFPRINETWRRSQCCKDQCERGEPVHKGKRVNGNKGPSADELKRLGLLNEFRNLFHERERFWKR